MRASVPVLFSRLFFVSLAAAPAWADDPPPETPEIRSSGEALGTGDRLKFYTQTDGFWLIENNEATTQAVAPCGAKFRIRDTDKSGETIYGYFYDVPSGAAAVRVGTFGRKCLPGVLANSVTANRDYQISTDRLMRAPANVNGWQFGVLVAPYKFHFSDDSTTPAATIGGYFGFQLGNPSVNVVPVLSVGLGAVDETTPPEPAGEGDEEKATGTLACLSAAGGVMFQIRKAGGFTVGVLLGGDWTGQKDRYRYDGKLWAAVTVGMALTK